jgi:hypothetical protein
MMAEQVDQEIYIYMGAGEGTVPPGVTHIRVDKSIRVIPEEAFYEHPNLVEFECHGGVERIGGHAFYRCPALKRVKISGVKAVDVAAFLGCESLTDVECDKLETIGASAFRLCKSLRCVKMPSIEIVEACAFNRCQNLMDVTFGDELERFEQHAFYNCPSLKRITIPLKDGMITHDDVFQGCLRLERVDLVDEVHETIATLQLEEWRKDMNEEIDRINQILPNTPAGSIYDPGEKTQAVRIWITSVLRKMEHYKSEHRSLLKEAATTLELALWKSRLCGDNNDVPPEGDEEKRAECRNDCGADMSIIIPNALSFLKIE